MKRAASPADQIRAILQVMRADTARAAGAHDAALAVEREALAVMAEALGMPPPAAVSVAPVVPPQLAGAPAAALLALERAAVVPHPPKVQGSGRPRVIRDKVIALLAESPDMPRPAMAKHLGISLGSLYQHVSQIKAAGELPPAPTRDTKADHVDTGDRLRKLRTDLESRRAAEAATSDDPSVDDVPARAPGFTLAQIMDEVARQQNGVRAKAVRFMACTNGGHGHRILVDRKGNGSTQADGTGHVHRVYAFVTSIASGHQHSIRTVVPSDAWD